VVKQLTDADRRTVGDYSRKPLLNRVVERELPLADQLQDDRRREGLCHTSDAGAVAHPDRRLWREIAQAARQADRPIADPNKRDRSGSAGSDDLVQGTLNRRRPTGGPMRRTCRLMRRAAVVKLVTPASTMSTISWFHEEIDMRGSSHSRRAPTTMVERLRRPACSYRETSDAPRQYHERSDERPSLSVAELTRASN
jgi:hypothetical protein